MVLDPNKLRKENFEQLALELQIEEVEGDETISEAEAKRRSGVALLALKERMEKDADIIRSVSSFDAAPRNVVTWADDFYFLLDAGWGWRVAAYIAWMTCPRRERFPHTQEDLANSVLGLTSDRQISTWRKKNTCIDEAIALMQAAPLMERRRDIFEALAESASDPSFHGAQDRKTALSMLGDYVPRQKIEVEREKVDPVDMTEAELAEVEKRRQKDG